MYFLNIYIFICLFIYLFIYLLCIYVFMYLLKYIFMSLTNYLFAYATFRKSFFFMHILFYAHLLHICVSVSVVLKFDSLEDLCELSIYGFCVKCLECCTATAKTCYHQRSKPINASKFIFMSLVVLSSYFDCHSIYLSMYALPYYPFFLYIYIRPVLA